MSEDAETKEWVRVSRAGNGKVTVTVTLQQDTLVIRWSVKAYSSSSALAAGLTEARNGARKALSEMQRVIAA